MVQNADWYRFDENGNMQVGYYAVDGRIYCFSYYFDISTEN